MHRHQYPYDLSSVYLAVFQKGNEHMFCPYCGAAGLGPDTICQACGRHTSQTDLDLELHPADEESLGTCPNCGALLESDERFCGQCGTRINARSSSNQPQAGRAIARTDTTPPPAHEPYALQEAGEHMVSWSNEESTLRFDWRGKESDGDTSSTEIPPHPSSPHATHRVSPGGGIQSRGNGNLPALPGLRQSAGTSSAHPRHSRAALVISLLCFLASLVSGGTAIWLAIGALH